MNHKLSTKILMFVIFLVMGSLVFGAISPPNNLNGYNRYTIKNYKIINGTNLSVNRVVSNLYAPGFNFTGENFFGNVKGNLTLDSSIDADGFSIYNLSQVNSTKGFYVDNVKITSPIISVCGNESCDYVTDGSCDDVEINAALREAYSSTTTGKSVVVELVSHGSYILCDPLIVRYNHNVDVTLKGQGSDATYLSWAVAGGDGIYLNNSNTGGGVYGGSTVEGLHLTGNGSGTAIKCVGNGVCLPYGTLENIHIDGTWHTGFNSNYNSMQNPTFRELTILAETVGMNLTNNVSASKETRHALFDHVSISGASQKYGIYMDRMWHSQFNSLALDDQAGTSLYCNDCQNNVFIASYTEGLGLDIDFNGYKNLFLGGRNWNTVRLGNDRATYDNTFSLIMSSPVNSFINISNNCTNINFDLGSNYGDSDLIINNEGLNSRICGYNSDTNSYDCSGNFAIDGEFSGNNNPLLDWSTLNQVPLDELILDLPFNDVNYINTSLTLDDSQLQINGITPDTWSKQGGFNNGGYYNLNGTQAIEIGTPSDYDFKENESFTISLWAKTPTIADAGYLLGKYQSGKYYNIYENSNDLRFGIDGGPLLDIRINNVIVINEWYMATAVYYGNKSGCLYYNGGSKACSSDPGLGDFSSTGTLTLGGLTAALAGYVGAIDNVMIFNKSLSDTEIQNLYEQRIEGTSAVGFRAKNNTWYGVNTFNKAPVQCPTTNSFTTYWNGATQTCTAINETAFTELGVSGDVNIKGNVTANNVFIEAYIRSASNSTINAAADKWYNVTFSKAAESLKHNINHTYNDATNETFIIMFNGTYDVSYTTSIQDVAALPSAHVALQLWSTTNDARVSGSYSEIDTTKQNSELFIHNSFLVYLTENEEIKLQFRSADDTVSIIPHGTYNPTPASAQLSIHRISSNGV